MSRKHKRNKHSYRHNKPLYKELVAAERNDDHTIPTDEQLGEKWDSIVQYLTKSEKKSSVKSVPLSSMRDVEKIISLRADVYTCSGQKIDFVRFVHCSMITILKIIGQKDHYYFPVKTTISAPY